MARAKSQPFAFDAITIEGGLISPVMLARVSTREAGEQTEADYAVPKGLTVRDEIARYFRIGQALFREAFATPTPAIAKTVSFTEDLLRDVFGFRDIKRVGSRNVGGHLYALTLEGLDGRVPVVVVPPADELDRASQHLPTDGRRRSASSALQDWLNANDEALWGLCCNGERLRLLRDNASLTRPAYIEANLRQIFETEDFASFAALWLLLHASRFGGASKPPTDAPLERWRDAGAKEGLTARDRLRDGVEAALLALGNGFLSSSANTDLRKRVVDGRLPLPDFFAQLLRLVYRLIFLMVAEDRGLLHPPNANSTARKLYDEGYSLRSLRERAIRSTAWDRYGDKWDGLMIVFKALARGEPKLGLPGLAGLFAPAQTLDLDGARLSNRSLLQAIYRLAWLKDDGALVPVNWRDMETEELGSVYESLLELTPRLIDEGRGFAFADGGETKGNTRKKTGSYYTPDSLVQVLLDSTLDPVLNGVEADAEDPAAALLGVSVIDPACGSGHFLLAAARRIATRVARARAGGVASAEDYRHALRDAVRACVHGVDRNPMAVELAKVALWIETVDPGKPLGFLDANVRCGDALFGVFNLDALRRGIPDEAYKALTGDDKETAKHFERLNKASREGQGSLDFSSGGGKLPAAPPLAGAARALRALPEDSPDEIAEKRSKFEAARNDPRQASWKVAADLYVAAFLTPKMAGLATVPTTAAVWNALSGGSIDRPLKERALELAGAARAFHWPLEFPDAISSGGFDVVLGNPPWEVMQLGEEEHFAQRMPELAELQGAARKRAIASLASEQPGAFADFEFEKRRFEAGNEFARASGRFDLTARGKVNTYALFAEMFAALATKRGRAGVIVPTGIATDATTAPFFDDLISRKRLFSLHDFQTGLGFFDRIGHARFKFCLLTVGQPGTGSSTPEFSFFSRTVEEFGDRRRHFTLSSESIARINPNTKTVATFRSASDAELAAKIYERVPILLDETKGAAGNQWNIEFRQGLFNMTSDSGLFRTASQLGDLGYARDGANWISPSENSPRRAARSSASTLNPKAHQYVPLLEAKMIHQFDHRWATYQDSDSRDCTLAEKKDLNFEPTPRYWVPESEVNDRLSGKSWSRGWLLGWRDICRATDERTVISTVFPRTGVGNKIPLIFPHQEQPAALIAALFGNLCSLTLDYCARQKVGGTSLNFFLLYQFPVLRPSAYGAADIAFILPRILELTYTSNSMTPFARDLGFNGSPFAWNEERRAYLRAELDAWYARAYGVTRDELRYIIDPADVMGDDHPSETFRVLKKNEMARFGEYRTARLVLQAWDSQKTTR